MANRGKQFETKFRDDWLESVPGSFCYRINDQMSGYVNIGNISDFICYRYPYCFIIDCKVKEGNTVPFSDLRQYERMLSYVGIPGLHLGFM